MTADVVNLRRARKARVRGAAEAKAEENRRKFGTAKSAREHDAAVRALDDRRFEGHRLAGAGSRQLGVFSFNRGRKTAAAAASLN